MFTGGGLKPHQPVAVHRACRHGGERRVLQAEGLAAFRGERLVFRDLSISPCRRAARCCWPGRTASGKSTLLRLLAGLVRPAAGRLLWNGEDALADLPRMARGWPMSGIRTR